MGNMEFYGKQKMCRWEKRKETQMVGLAAFTTENSLLVSAANELWGAAAGLSGTSGAVAEDRKEGWGGGRGWGLEAAWQHRPCSPPPVSRARSVPLSHCILQTFTLFKDKCIVNSVSPHTRYVRCSTPSTAKGLSPLLPTRHATNEIKWILLECRII